MATVSVKLIGLGDEWTKASRQAVKDLNSLFKRNKIKVSLATGGKSSPIITVKIDSTIKGDAVHGKTSAETSGSGTLIKAAVGLPTKVTINTPSGVRNAGLGIFEIIVAHEIVHALGDSSHSSHLMGKTMYKVMGDKAVDDKLRAGTVNMPPLKLSNQSVKTLKAIWK